MEVLSWEEPQEEYRRWHEECGCWRWPCLGRGSGCWRCLGEERGYWQEKEGDLSRLGRRWRWKFLGRNFRKRRNIGVGTRKVGVIVGLALVGGVGVGDVRARNGVTGGPVMGGMSVFVGEERGIFVGGGRSVLGGGGTRLPLTFKALYDIVYNNQESQNRS